MRDNSASIPWVTCDVPISDRRRACLTQTRAIRQLESVLKHHEQGYTKRIFLTSASTDEGRSGLCRTFARALALIAAGCAGHRRTGCDDARSLVCDGPNSVLSRRLTAQSAVPKQSHSGSGYRPPWRATVFFQAQTATLLLAGARMQRPTCAQVTG
jgi:hypothetical protein